MHRERQGEIPTVKNRRCVATVGRGWKLWRSKRIRLNSSVAGTAQPSKACHGGVCMMLDWEASSWPGLTDQWGVVSCRAEFIVVDHRASRVILTLTCIRHEQDEASLFFGVWCLSLVSVRPENGQSRHSSRVRRVLVF